jgi:hypothetical protein
MVSRACRRFRIPVYWHCLACESLTPSACADSSCPKIHQEVRFQQWNSVRGRQRMDLGLACSRPLTASMRMAGVPRFLTGF